MPILADLDPVAGQGRAAKHALHDAKVFPGLIAIDFGERLEADVLPVCNEYFDVLGVHRAIAKQVLVVPDAPADQAVMVGEALLPATWILFFDGTS